MKIRASASDYASSPPGHRRQARRKTAPEQRSQREKYRMISSQRDTKKKRKSGTKKQPWRSIASCRAVTAEPRSTQSAPRSAGFNLLLKNHNVFIKKKKEKNLFWVNYWSISCLAAFLLSSFSQLLNPPTKDQMSNEPGTSLREGGTRGDVPQKDSHGAGNEEDASPGNPGGGTTKIHQKDVKTCRRRDARHQPAAANDIPV